MARLRNVAFGACLALVLGGPAQAVPVVCAGAGCAVSVAGRTATFTAVVAGTDLTAYSENSLSITVPELASIGFDPSLGSGGFSGGFHYPDGGAFVPTVITTTDAAIIYGIEFNVGNGLGSIPTTHFAYLFLSGGLNVGEGAFDATNGSVLGFSNSAGFDSLRIGAFSSLAEATAALADDLVGAFQGIAIDNVRVQLTDPGTQIPEPASIVLLGAGLLGLRWARRRR